MRITAAADAQLGFRHPENTDWAHISFCEIAAPIRYEDGVAVSRNAVAIRPGKIDRSPCGTGCSARLAVLHARGVLAVGQAMIGRSIIDSRFDCRIESETSVGGRRADRSVNRRISLDHRHASTHAGPDRPLARRLSVVGHLAEPGLSTLACTSCHGEERSDDAISIRVCTGRCAHSHEIASLPRSSQ